jgi:nucleotide-binding universal stress UspA family protein
MFQKLLVPLDLTERHKVVLDVAAEMAQAANGEVALLHVIETIHGLSVDDEKSFFLQLEHVAARHLEKHADVLKERQVRCRSVVLKGNRAVEIARYANESGTDLIFLTAPWFDPEQPAAGWGSMSYKVALLAQCHVLFVKQPPMRKTQSRLRS